MKTFKSIMLCMAGVVAAISLAVAIICLVIGPQEFLETVGFSPEPKFDSVARCDYVIKDPKANIFGYVNDRGSFKIKNNTVETVAVYVTKKNHSCFAIGFIKTPDNRYKAFSLGTGMIQTQGDYIELSAGDAYTNLPKGFQDYCEW